MKKSIAYITTFALCISGLSHFSTPDASANTPTHHTFRRIVTGKNDRLLRYDYIDDMGNKVIPASAEQTSSTKKATTLPSSYDSREYGVVTPIRDQGITGSCWAFGALKSLEASSIQQGISPLEDTDYSESHLAWYSYVPTTNQTSPVYGDYIDSGISHPSDIYSIGGSAYISLFTLANWWGAANESEAPFAANTYNELDNMSASMNQKADDFRFQSDVILREANCYDYSENNAKSRNKIKKAIMENGALDVAVYYDNAYIYQDDDVTSLYQTDYEPADANHCVTIIGWDDDFNTFLDTPRKSGAWLIANSYGEDSNTNGYFWLSYYDTSICEIFSFTSQTTDTYDTNFQYDGTGWSEGYYDTDDISMANIFTNDTATPQSIRAAAFYTYGEEQAYNIQVYRNISGNGPLDGELVSSCTTSGTAQQPGYHTVDLNDSIAVAPGEKFSVVITFLADLAPDNIVYALVEGSDANSYNFRYSSQKGQSFVYFASENTWYDNAAYKDYETNETFNMNNVCLKAFTKEISQEEYDEQEDVYIPETPIPTETPTAKPTATANILPGQTATTYNPFASNTPAPTASASTRPTGSIPFGTVAVKNNKITIGTGEKVKLKINTSPASNVNNLTCTSSDTSVATVNNQGKVTGISPGTAFITIDTLSGVSTIAKVTVKKAPKSIKASVTKKKIKKGKTAKIKIKLSKGSASYKISYKALNKKIATVNAKGKIKAKKKGTAKFRVTTYNKKKATVKIKVR